MAKNCLDEHKFPKILQTETNRAHSSATAITGHESTSAVFVGGMLTQSEWTGGSADPWVFVGKITLGQNLWSWQKQLRQEQLSTVTALSVSPDGAKLACYGMQWLYTTEPVSSTSDQGYIFILDAKNGAIMSRLVYMKHS